MQPLANILSKTLDQVKATDSSKPSLTAPSKSLALHQDQEGIRTLSNLLAQCFDIFPLYGREPEAADNIRKAFRVMLADYSIDKISEAFRYHLKHSREFPVPADIVCILERGNKPPFERSVYVRLSQKRKEFPESMTRDEWAYMEDYERFIVSGKN